MNLFTNREQLLATAGSLPGHDVLTCALQLMMTALTIIDISDVPSDVGAHLDHAMQKLADYLCASIADLGAPDFSPPGE